MIKIILILISCIMLSGCAAYFAKDGSWMAITPFTSAEDGDKKIAALAIPDIIVK